MGLEKMALAPYFSSSTRQKLRHDLSLDLHVADQPFFDISIFAFSNIAVLGWNAG